MQLIRMQQIVHITQVTGHHCVRNFQRDKQCMTHLFHHLVNMTQYRSMRGTYICSADVGHQKRYCNFHADSQAITFDTMGTWARCRSANHTFFTLPDCITTTTCFNRHFPDEPGWAGNPIKFNFLPILVPEQKLWDKWQEFFMVRMPFLSPGQQCQSTEGNISIPIIMLQSTDCHQKRRNGGPIALIFCPSCQGVIYWQATVQLDRTWANVIDRLHQPALFRWRRQSWQTIGIKFNSFWLHKHKHNFKLVQFNNIT